MKISIASDHAGFEQKQELRDYLTGKGHEVVDRGPDSDDRVDYPDFTSLGVWQAKDAPFLCIEPWCGSADFDDCSGVFAEKRGIEILAPGAEKTFTYAITAVEHKAKV